MEKDISTFRAVYPEEVDRQLRRVGFGVGPMEDGLLPVSLNEHPICWVSGKGTVFFRDKAPDPKVDQAREQASKIARETAEYVRLLERAPPLVAEGLSSPYKTLAEFNGIVLAGELGQFGAEFATWEWVQDRTSLWQGHYHDSYENAKRDFVTRSGLLPESTLFTPEQSFEM